MTEKRTINIAAPMIGDAEKAAVMDVLDSGMLVQGAKVAEFEALFADYHNSRNAIATSNGTTALTTALLAVGVQPGDEVIIPSFTFAATATSVLSARATPVFVDVKPDTFCIDPDLIEAAITPRTRAIMPVHLYGQLADMDRVAAIASEHGLMLVEDAAQCHGAKISSPQGDRYAGNWGAACFSFYPSKNMSTGEGGMVLTQDDAVAERARMVRNHGMSTRYLHEVEGFNFRMTNLQAAIGVEQIKRLPEWTARRIHNAAYLSANLKGVQTPVVKPGHTHVFHQYTIVVPPGADRDAVMQQLNDAGVGARVYYPLPVHCQPVFYEGREPGMSCACGHGKNCPNLPVSLDLSKRVISLPVHPALSQDDLDYIVEQVNALMA